LKRSAGSKVAPCGTKGLDLVGGLSNAAAQGAKAATFVELRLIVEIDPLFRGAGSAERVSTRKSVPALLVDQPGYGIYSKTLQTGASIAGNKLTVSTEVTRRACMKRNPVTGDEKP